MNTNNSCCENTVNTGCNHRTGNSFLIIVVLYILLAIIVGSYLY